jgi:hypothetical protein
MPEVIGQCLIRWIAVNAQKKSFGDIEPGVFPMLCCRPPIHFLRMALQSNAAPGVSHEHTSTERRKTVCPPPICLLTLAHAGVYALVRRYEESGGILSTRSAPDQAL